MKWMLDTNICIYIINKRPESVIRRMEQHDPKDLCLSALTVAELSFGVAKSESSKNLVALQAFLSTFDVTAFNAEDAWLGGELRASLARQGKTIGPYDTLIAAQALRLGYCVVTNNVREFERVPGLALVNWAD